MIPVGVQYATSANVGEQIGAGNSSMAKKHAWTHMGFAVLIMSIIMVFIRVYDDAVARIFTSDPEDILYIHSVL